MEELQQTVVFSVFVVFLREQVEELKNVSCKCKCLENGGKSVFSNKNKYMWMRPYLRCCDDNIGDGGPYCLMKTSRKQLKHCNLL